MVLSLYDCALEGVSGFAKFSEVLDTTDDEVVVFDKSFPYKEKLVLPCQEEYEIACATLNE